MTLVETACRARGRFLLVEERRQVITAHVCDNCFESAATVDEIADEHELCRTLSKRGKTVHRTQRDAGEHLSYQENGSENATEAHTALSEMDPEEFEERVLGGSS